MEGKRMPYVIREVGFFSWLFGNKTFTDNGKVARKFDTKVQAESHRLHWFGETSDDHYIVEPS